jgi:ABC-2 type transport system permease protein
MTDQIIYDRGYRSYDGPRLGPPGARRAIFKDGIKRVLGLGRKARMKIFPWLLISIGLAVAAGLIGAHWLIGDLAESVGEGIVPSHGEMFDIYGWIALLFIALAGPQLLIPDRSRGVLSVYFSRPLTVDGYLASKAGAFAAVVGVIYLLPQFLLHLGLALISDDGFLPYLGDNLDILWKVPATALGFIVLHGALVFAISAIVDRQGIAAATFLGLFIATRPIAFLMTEASFPGSNYFTLIALDHHPRIIRDYLFNNTTEYPAEAAGFEVWVSLLVIVVLVGLSAWFVRSRYQRLA